MTQITAWFVFEFSLLGDRATLHIGCINHHYKWIQWSHPWQKSKQYQVYSIRNYSNPYPNSNEKLFLKYYFELPAHEKRFESIFGM